MSPNRIITLTDFPVYNQHVLKIFYRIYLKGCGNIIPPCPVLHKRYVIPSFDKRIITSFKAFEKKNPDAEYFLLDGSHKTTAATLTHHKIKSMIFNNDKDIKKAKEMVKKGELLSLTVGNSIKDNVKDLKKHFSKNTCFETTEQKTMRMIIKKVIPAYIIRRYKK